MKKHTKIMAVERDNIAIWLAEKTSLREIARRLGRSVSSIKNEIQRNSQNGVYKAVYAQSLSEERIRCGRSKSSKKPKWIFDYATEKLRCGWSPEQIAGRLKREFGYSVVCHETIYRYIYAKENKDKNLAEYLVRNHRKRYKKGYKYLPRRGIQGKVSIHDRPKEIDDRSVFGHWETDVVEGKNHVMGIQTMLERKTRLYEGKLMENIDSINGFKSQIAMLSKYPSKSALSVTMDNGKENYDHRKLNTFGISTYFCDPYSSWQKGSNENHNGVLRRYIPKGTDLKGVSQNEVNEITDEMNNKPRKCLDYETPKEAFTREIQSIKLRCSDLQ